MVCCLCLEWRLCGGGKYAVKDIVDQLSHYQSALIMGFVTQLLLFCVLMTNRDTITVLNSASQRHVIKYTHLHEMKWRKEVSREHFNISVM